MLYYLNYIFDDNGDVIGKIIVKIKLYVSSIMKEILSGKPSLSQINLSEFLNFD